jgi:hypothetical protein
MSHEGHKYFASRTFIRLVKNICKGHGPMNMGYKLSPQWRVPQMIGAIASKEQFYRYSDLDSHRYHSRNGVWDELQVNRKMCVLMN